MAVPVEVPEHDDSAQRFGKLQQCPVQIGRFGRDGCGHLVVNARRRVVIELFSRRFLALRICINAAFTVTCRSHPPKPPDRYCGNNTGNRQNTSCTTSSASTVLPRFPCNRQEHGRVAPIQRCDSGCFAVRHCPRKAAPRVTHDLERFGDVLRVDAWRSWSDSPPFNRGAIRSYGCAHIG